MTSRRLVPLLLWIVLLISGCTAAPTGEALQDYLRYVAARATDAAVSQAIAAAEATEAAAGQQMAQLTAEAMGTRFPTSTISATVTVTTTAPAVTGTVAMTTGTPEVLVTVVDAGPRRRRSKVPVTIIHAVRRSLSPSLAGPAPAKPCLSPLFMLFDGACHRRRVRPMDAEKPAGAEWCLSRMALR